MTKEELISKAEKMLIEMPAMDNALFSRSKEQRLYDFYLARIEHLESLEKLEPIIIPFTERLGDYERSSGDIL